MSEAAAAATAGAPPPGAAAPLVRLRGLAKRYGAAEAVRPLDLDVASGDFCAILGPSGCGKSTLLRMIAGFVAPTAGRVEIDGRDVTALGPERRPTNMVFQSYGLFPHLTVAQNVGFGLSLARLPRAEVEARVAAMLGLVRLDGLGNRGVLGLSGGQQQRVALARALVMRPKVLLLDEPLAALDFKLRQRMHEELRRIHREAAGTFVFVTHDQSEAFALASRVVVMNAGAIEQEGTPREVYLEPRTPFVADFVGEANLLRGRRAADLVTLDAGPAFADPGPDGPVRLVVRPEHVRPGGAADGFLAVRAHVADAVFLGDALRVTAALPSGERLRMRDAAGAAAAGPAPYRAGEPMGFRWPVERQRLLPAS